MKKLVMIFCLLLLLVSCTRKKPSLPVVSQLEKPSASSTFQQGSNQAVSLDYFSAGRFTATIIEDKESVYFAKRDGIYKKLKRERSATRIYKVEKVDRLALYNDKLYFMMDDQQTICCMNKDGAKHTTVFNGRADGLIGEDEYIFDYQITNNVLYLATSNLAISYNLLTKNVKELVGDDGIETFQVFKDHFYYIDHAKRSFTVYKLDPNTLKTKIILGQGTSEPSMNIYQNFLWAGESLYFYKQMPMGLYQWKDGKESIISDEDICNLFSYENRLNYVVFEPCSSDLNQYDPESESVNTIATLKEFNASRGLTIVDKYVYFNSGVKIEKDQYGHILYNYDGSKPTAIHLNNK